MPMTNQRFSVYLTQPIRGEYGLIILTVGEENNSFVAEYFILMKSKDHIRTGSRHYYPQADFLKKEYNYDLDLVEKATLDAVQAALDSYLFEKSQKDGDHFWIDHEFTPERTEDYRLLMFAMHGLFREDLDFVANKTVCDPLVDYLRKALDVRQVTKLDQGETPKTK